MIDTVIFDMDGVLLDSEPIHQRVNMGYFARLGVSVSQDFYEQNFVGLPLKQMLITLQERHALPQDVDAMVAECMALLHEDFMHAPLTPAPGVEDLLKMIHEKELKVAVGSSSPPDLIALIIERLGLAKYFHCLLSGNQVEKGKPNPDIFLKISDLLKTSPAYCVVIEDSALGLEAAYRAGMKAVGVHPPSSNQNMERATLTVAGFGQEARQRIMRLLQE